MSADYRQPDDEVILCTVALSCGCEVQATEADLNDDGERGFCPAHQWRTVTWQGAPGPDGWPAHDPRGQLSRDLAAHPCDGPPGSSRSGSYYPGQLQIEEDGPVLG
jgi:hypothetical protein